MDNTFDHNLALIGVFTSGTPTGGAPARLDITAMHSLSTIAPLLNQSFFIGDGRTGRTIGGFQNFAVPEGATALQLGIADADSLLGLPRSYGNNAGSLTAVFNVSPRNLLSNGNFELGYTGFFTDYLLNPLGADSTLYLNGTEVFRSNMPNGPVTSLTPALVAISGADESIFIATNANSSLFIEGTNLIAVEFHQSSAASADISFDLVLSGLSFSPPSLSLQREGANYLISWPALPACFRLESASNLLAVGSWQLYTNSTAAVTNGLKSIRHPVQIGSRFFKLSKP